jgi:ubiquinone/menaquinone biosynthesis C-methylase UbiE
MKKLLHVGCGPKTQKNLKGFNSDNWIEYRLDIDNQHNPDILGSIIDINAVQNMSMDAVYSAHNIEHIFAHEVKIALKEFNRVLKEDGYLVITCPDLQILGEALANDKLNQAIGNSKSGPISPIDIIYGHRGFIAQGHTFMAHKTGFTYKTLSEVVFESGFKMIYGNRFHYDLWMIAFKKEMQENDMKYLASIHLP